MKIGWDHYTIAHRNLAPLDALALAKSHGALGMQFLEPEAVAPGLDPDALDALRNGAASMEMYLEIGLPCPNPYRASRLEGSEISTTDMAARLTPHVEAAARLGVKHARIYVGDRHDRFRLDPDWPTQLEATQRVLRKLAPALRSNHLRLAVETHADLTVEEMLRFLDGIDPDITGVTLDTGNLAMRLQEPVRAAERLAHRVLCTHLKDAVLDFSTRGLRWQARPVGTGVVPIDAIVQILRKANPHLNLSVELHPRIYDLPIFDSSWLAFFPDLTPAGLAAIVKLAAKTEQRINLGTISPLDEVEAIPWTERDLAGLDQSIAYLRQLITF